MSPIFKPLSALLLLSISLSAPAQTPDDSGREKILDELRNYKHEFLARELGLSREQQRAFFTVYDEMDDRLMTINDETRELERTVFENEKCTDTEAEAAARAIFEQKQKEGNIELEYFDKFKTILTPKQLVKLKSTEKRFTQSLVRHHRRMTRDDAKTKR